MKRLVAAIAAGAILLSACGDDSSSSPPDDLHAPAVPETCDAIRAGKALSEVGITYDYEPSESILELAEWSEAVFRGRVAWVSNLESQFDEVVVLHVEVDEIGQDGSGEMRLGDIVLIGVRYNPAEVGFEAIRDAIPLGLELVAFVERERGFGFRNHLLEGLFLACGDEGAVRAGVRPGWLVPRTLDAILQPVKGE